MLLISSSKLRKKINKACLVLVIVITLNFGIPVLEFKTNFPLLNSKQNKVSALSVFTPTSGQLVTGSSVATDVANTGSYRGSNASDDNYWTVARVAAVPSLNLQITINGVTLHNANKIIFTVEDSNTTTATAYIHQVCDWVTSTGVDNAADAQCTGGGWRTLHPRRTTYTNTTDTSRNYEIYDGYFSTRVTTPGTVISTPLTNFVSSGNLLFRTYSNVSATTQYKLDALQVETAIDPVYEPAAVNLTASGTTTNFISDLVGAASTNVTASDNTKFQVPMSAINNSIDMYFTFKNVRTYTGANTILISPEICVSNTALTFGIYLYNFTTSSWTQLGSSITGTLCTTDTDYASAFNSYALGGFNINDYVSNTKDVRFRILTNAPSTVYNIQLDRVYMMIGSVNTDSAKCEISWGTGTSTNCTNTRTINEGKTTTTAASTWQATAALEYPTTYYSLDNDDDATNAEYAASQNLSFPVSLNSNMAATGIHYAVKYRSNSTAQTMDLGIRDYSGIQGTSGWVATPGTDTNALTTYSWFDTWNIAEYASNIEDTINTVDGLMNLRARTSAGTTTNPGTRDWSFAMMSIRWVEESARSTFRTAFSPTSGSLLVGAETATSASNTGSWQATLGNDSTTNGSGNYWHVSRDAVNGLNLQLRFDGVETYSSNKMILTIEDANITTATAYVHQICDWVSTTGVNNAADAQCTGGGWRTLNPRLANYTSTSDTTRTYEIYNGLFSDRTTSPGTAYSTPLTNFVSAANGKRVLIRVYSNVAATTQLRIELAQLEVAIDPVYEPTGLTKINSYAGATTNYISDLVTTTASDNNKLTLTNNATNPMDFYLSFQNVNLYTGANALLVKPEICVSAVALTFNIWAYNFSTTSWTQLNTGLVTGTACTTDTAYAYALNPSNLSDYVSGGEVRIRFNTSTLNTNTFQLDRIYMMVGSVNSDTSKCEISWGTGTDANCNATQTVSDAETGSTANTTTWQQTSTLEYDSDYYSLDNDDDATNAEAAYSSNLSMPVSLTSGMNVTAIHYAGRFRSNVTTLTVQLGARDQSGKMTTGGWSAIGATNALTTYSWTDSWQSSEHLTSPYQYIDTNNNLANLRLRTTTSTAVSAGTVRDWDFAMVSIRWNEQNTGTLSVDIVDSGGNSVTSPSIDFSSKETLSTCQTSTGTFGTSSQKIRIENDTTQPSWSLAISANGGSSSTWNSGATDKYDFNDGAGTPNGCSDGGDTDTQAGQMSLDFTGATITPGPGCSSTGINFASNASYSEGSTDSITIITAGSTAQTNCYWDITGIGVNQKIPSEQIYGNYSISMNLTIVSN